MMLLILVLVLVVLLIIITLTIIVMITIFLDSGRAAVQISRGGAAVMRLPLAATMAAG